MSELNTLSPRRRKPRKRVGRGSSSGHGKTSGRGMKGQKSRSGYSRQYGFEGGQMPLHRRLPKRGFVNPPRRPLAEVNLDVLDKAFEEGAEVTREALLAKHLVKKHYPGLKVLGRGELSKKLTVKADAFSATARQKIENAGGTIEMLERAPARAVVRRGQRGKGKE